MCQSRLKSGQRFESTAEVSADVIHLPMQHIDLGLQSAAMGVQPTAKVDDLCHVQDMDVQQGSTTLMAARWTKSDAIVQGLCFDFDVGEHVRTEHEEMVGVKLIQVGVPSGPVF